MKLSVMYIVPGQVPATLGPWPDNETGVSDHYQSVCEVREKQPVGTIIVILIWDNGRCSAVDELTFLAEYETQQARKKTQRLPLLPPVDYPIHIQVSAGVNASGEENWMITGCERDSDAGRENALRRGEHLAAGLPLCHVRVVHADGTVIRIISRKSTERKAG